MSGNVGGCCGNEAVGVNRCYDPNVPDGKLRKVGDEWIVNWLSQTMSFREDPGGYIYRFFQKDGHDGYVQFNPTTNDIFATEGYLRNGMRISGRRAEVIIEHARRTIFRDRG